MSSKNERLSDEEMKEGTVHYKPVIEIVCLAIVGLYCNGNGKNCQPRCNESKCEKSSKQKRIVRRVKRRWRRAVLPTPSYTWIIYVYIYSATGLFVLLRASAANELHKLLVMLGGMWEHVLMHHRRTSACGHNLKLVYLENWLEQGCCTPVPAKARPKACHKWE